eukprot:gnl/TRDRNA2_/TRDRNA2_174493_c0_seq2.p1 gnl/TRDRNA2_/TRDRNA2_174493_c0~~gnl/TRDRNA2_/TRDRNA2_174493_c0_seq2.p1  ORF type:complete len:228 (-),score=54.09 gnl/TRDRNA2_/TRDRNA2_174493_c0_seq2:186-815(-)
MSINEPAVANRPLAPGAVNRGSGYPKSSEVSQSNGTSAVATANNTPWMNGTTTPEVMQRKLKEFRQEMQPQEHVPPQQPVQMTKQQDLEEASTTTVMIRNIACQYDQEQIKTFLDHAGMKGTFDFLYLPLNTTRRGNLGYVFVNFVSTEHAEFCKEQLDGKVLGTSKTHKRCEVTMAFHQGLKESGSRRFNRKKTPLFFCPVENVVDIA